MSLTLRAVLSRTAFCTLAVVLMGSSIGCSSGVRQGMQAFEQGDYATAQQEWTPLAQRGDAKAQYLLGLMHQEGRGVEQDSQQAMHWYQLAADQGHASPRTTSG